MQAAKLFYELGKIISLVNSNADTTALRLTTPEGEQLLSYLNSGLSTPNAMARICNSSENSLKKILFGPSNFEYDELTDQMISRLDNKILEVGFKDKTDFSNLINETDHEWIFLKTDFKKFEFFKIVKDQPNNDLPFANYSLSEISEEINFTGSIWANIYPNHYGFLTRTISYTFPKEKLNQTIFNKPKVNSSQYEKENSIINSLKNGFDNDKGCLISLNKLCSKLESDVRLRILLSETKQEKYQLRRYSPFRSSIFDFGEPCQTFTRTDFVTTYNIGNEEFHRDFFLLPTKLEASQNSLERSAFDILHTLAIRRTSLFRLGFASRLYNILLPPVFLTYNSTPFNSYIIFPCLLLYRVGKEDFFRSTINITFIVIPTTIDNSGFQSRSSTLDEIYKIKNELLPHTIPFELSTHNEGYTISGPLKDYLSLSKQSSIPNLLNEISKGISHNLLVKKGDYFQKIDTTEIIEDSIFVQSRISNMVTTFLQVEWAIPQGFSQPWDRWLSGKDKAFESILYRTISYRDYFNPYFANLSRNALDYKKLNIGNILGADMTGMTFYNPREDMKVIIFPKIGERYPNYSLLRWMAWHYYIDSALTSLRLLIEKFHFILEDRNDLNFIIRTLNEMIQEFVDLYDLDLTNYFYRKEYEKLRELLHIDLDYKQLISQFNSSKEDSSLREQRLINKLIVSLTLVTVTVTVMSTIATNGHWGNITYLIISLLSSIIVSWIGYVLFDPIRRFFQKIYFKFIKN